MPKPTIRFYNQFNTYMGWKYLNKVTYFELKSWLKSGNYFMFKNQLFDELTSDKQIFLLLRKSK